LVDHPFIGVIFAAIVNTKDLEISVCLCEKPLETHFDPPAGVVHGNNNADQVRGFLRRTWPDEVPGPQRVQPPQHFDATADFLSRLTGADVWNLSHVTGQVPGKVVLDHHYYAPRSIAAILRDRKASFLN
jgi:hypothetical protein